MKLTKKQLEEFIVGSMRDNMENGWDYSEESAALKALEKNELEIEGYERVEWHKFDPDDESTFPPVLTPILVVYDQKESFGISFFSYADVVLWRVDKVTYWRPLFYPSVEQVEKQLKKAAK